MPNAMVAYYNSDLGLGYGLWSDGSGQAFIQASQLNPGAPMDAADTISAGKGTDAQGRPAATGITITNDPLI